MKMPQSLIYYPSFGWLACVDRRGHGESQRVEVGLCTRATPSPLRLQNHGFPCLITPTLSSAR
ncbi:hypothetical protein GT037_003575 [Alternaria burnsii]|uniref:Uncharacterized protein n=1 Tax=Alternaria burnsii TaxID=1187904 RepID=A0A8H7B6P4_9PLEO|nr:uncharacterized protein GT037_003575 [Alternaria burnsii]KAF7678194.1 hypothetical protein GT037_003575 [Alternaria burnsii]